MPPSEWVCRTPFQEEETIARHSSKHYKDASNCCISGARTLCWFFWLLEWSGADDRFPSSASIAGLTGHKKRWHIRDAIAAKALAAVEAAAFDLAVASPAFFRPVP